MELNSGGYSAHQYKAKALRRHAEDAATFCNDIIEMLDVDVIAVTGKSGMSVAFAAQMIKPFPLMVIRKETDQSHGSMIEGPGGLVVKRYVILDDFVDSGATIKRVLTQISNAHGGDEAKCVAVAQYKRGAYETGARVSGILSLGIQDYRLFGEGHKAVMAEFGAMQTAARIAEFGALRRRQCATTSLGKEYDIAF